MSQSASHVVLSYPAAIGEWGRDELEKSTYRRYLGRVHDSAEPGDRWEEFVGSDCGNPTDVTLQVERVEGGERVSEDTEFAFEPRDGE